MRPSRGPDWGVRALLVAGVLILLAFSASHLTAQTQPMGVTPSSFATLTVLGTLTGNTWLGTSTMTMTVPGSNVLRFIGNGVQIMTVNSTNDSPWNFATTGALTAAGSGTLVMATTTVLNASGTLRNAPMNFNELNLYLTVAGMQGWCGNCTPAGAFDQTCAAGAGNGSLAVRDAAGVFKCYS